MGNVYYRGRITVRDAVESDIEALIPNIRDKEIRETLSLAGYGIDEAVRNSYSLANKRLSCIAPDGEVIVMMGSADLRYNCGHSLRLGLLSGYGGTLFSFSAESSSRYALELVRRAGPVMYRELTSGYDFMSVWVADYMTEALKWAAMHGFKTVEIAVGDDGTVFRRIEWRKEGYRWVR